MPRPDTTPGPQVGPSIADVLAEHRGAGSPRKTAARVAEVIEARGDDGTWITYVGRDALLGQAGVSWSPDVPLYGVPFAVKDSIDVAGQPTTLACPDFAYVAETTAPAVQRLLDAGALYVGKTNLDQLATGLNGTRTAYTIPRSVYGNDLISGGSSSGSALAVALGEVPFAVATDTAGSGRVPAALNGIVGFKPSRGVISAVGLVPACKSLDCVTLMAGTVADIRTVFDVIAAPDDGYEWSRARGPAYDGRELRIGLPPGDQLSFFGDEPMRIAHTRARETIADDFKTVEVSLRPFLAAGELLYQGPWVAERLVEFEDLLTESPESIHPVVREILRSGYKFTAIEAFRAQQQLQVLKFEVARLWRDMDVMVVPTIGTTFTVEEVLANPIGCNTMLGHYTHFGNLLDLVGISVPAGLTEDGRPASVMVLGPALSDDTVLHVAAALQASLQ
ncbi:allophanate hydrolase [Smaragdicoccus niigatensis]|uniref:allophanate hydrolase n=1 Tax=Smaragdicoccus niigatensis TaxID=359359 RepID=UPI0003A04F6C|nr:allophanate hydrolase [Smaragdicoccus niigatensis]